jgi:DNA-binding GntR family transcriptional regulator
MIRHSSDAAAPRTLAEHAVRAIEEAILRGDFQPGQRLLLDELATSLDMSPMPIREALRRLETLGFVQSQAHRGARVREVSAEDLLDLYRTRLPLEVMAIRQAAKQFGAAEGDRAERMLDQYTTLYERGDPIAAREAHLDFHFTLYAASGSEWLLHAIRPLCQYGERYRVSSIGARGPMESRYREHADLLAACRAKDPLRAGQALANHLLTTVQVLLPHLTGTSPASAQAVMDEFVGSLAESALTPTDTAALSVSGRRKH